MRYIIVPDDITLQHYASGKPVTKADGTPEDPFSMGRYLLAFVLPDPALGKEKKDLRAVRQVRKFFSAVKPGDVVALEEDHWDRVRIVIEKPSQAVAAPTILEQFYEFMEAFCEAKTSPPTGYKAKLENVA